ncbi:MAG: hypothetical protein GKR94_16880 [Gammaproteobacteria bacterium]|nr:hypothetical protein [Gammaproteobacteria bacterium]
MPKKPHKLLEAVLENIEAVVDALTDNEIVKSIPFVGTMVKLVTGGADLRDRIFVSKVQRFIEQAESTSQQDRMKFRKQILSDDDQMRRIGEAVLLVLDKLSDLRKADLLGMFYACFLGGHLDGAQFRRLAAAIDTAFIDDLESFLEHGDDELPYQQWHMEQWHMEQLVSSGLTTPSAVKIRSEAGKLLYEPSTIGRKMIELWREHGPR